MEKITFSKESRFGTKGETRNVTDTAAYQFAKLSLIENPDKITASVDSKREKAAKAEQAEKAKMEARAKEKLAGRQEELRKDHDALEQAKKDLKKPIETKEEKKGPKVVKAPRL